MPRNGQYILDGDGEPIECINLTEWARWFQANDRHVAKDTVNGFFVSTVFLGLDHSFGEGPPVLWETMIFAPDNWTGLEQWRYTSRADALAGHARAVEMAASFGKEHAHA